MKRLWKTFITMTVILFLSANMVFAGAAVDRIKERGFLIVGSTATGVPTTFLDTKSGKIVGIMVDVAQEFADHLGVELKVIETPWSSLMPSLLSHKIDLICAAMAITEKRLEVVDFSDPIFPYAETLVVRKDDPKDYKGIDDIRGLKVGAVVGTVYAKNLEKEGFNDLKIYNNHQDIMKELTIGRIDAAICDGPIAGWLIRTNKDIKVKIPKSYTVVWPLQIGSAVNKEDKDLKVEVNKVVKKLHETGKIKEILAKWGQ